MSVKTSPRGKGPVGSSRKAPEGEYTRHRKRNPGEFEEGSFRTVEHEGEKMIIGTLKSTGKRAVQSILKPINK